MLRIQSRRITSGADAIAPGLLPFADLGRKRRDEPVVSGPPCFVADLNAALVEQVIDVPQGARKAKIQHHGETDHLGRRYEVAERTVLRVIQRG